MTTDSTVTVDKPIAVFLPSLVAGGVGRVFVDLMNAFVSRGQRVDLLLCRSRGPHLARLDPRIRVIELPREGRLRSRWRILQAHPGPWWELLRPVLLSLSDASAQRAIAGLADYLVNHRPRALLCGKTHTNLAALWAAHIAGTGTRVVVSERTQLSLQIRMKRPWRWRHIARVVGRLYPEAHAITSVSDGVSDDLARCAKIDRHRILTIYNPIDIDRIRELSAEPVEHRWFGDPGTEVILSAGRLVQQKNFVTLIDAFAELVQRSPQAQSLRLLIFGEGGERRALEERIAEHGLDDRIELPGYVENPFRFMARARLFVLSSSWEGLPSALIEALACGCPVVSSDCKSGPREILVGGRFGRLVPVGDSESLAEAIEHTLGETPQRDALRARAADFSVDAAVERYLATLLD